MKNLARKLLQDEAQIKNLFQEKKIVTLYSNIIKNQVASLEKVSKESKKTLIIIDNLLLNENVIYDGSYIIDKWH